MDATSRHKFPTTFPPFPQVEGVLQLTNQGSRWNALAVDPAAGSNNVTMLFIGTEQGYQRSKGIPRYQAQVTISLLHVTVL